MSFFKTAATVTGATLMSAPVLLAISPAFAVTACPITTVPAATLVAPGVCEVSFTEAGDTTFEVPTGVSKISALLVGAGGGAGSYYGEYAGGGGDVVFVDSVDLSSSVLAIHVGLYGNSAGSNEGEGEAGEDTTLDSYTAAGGEGGFPGSNTVGGASGNGNLGWYDSGEFGSGGGAGGAAEDYTGGPGVTASAAAGSNAFFPAVVGEIEYGHGGQASDGIEYTPPIDYYSEYGHGANTFVGSYGDGAGGAVILRFSSEISPVLAETGGSAPIGLAAGSLIAGAALIAMGRRRKA